MLWKAAAGTVGAAGKVAASTAKITAKAALLTAPAIVGGAVGVGIAAVKRGVPFALRTARRAYGPLGFGFLGARGGLLGRLAIPGAMIGAYAIGKAGYGFIRGPEYDWEGARYTYNPEGRTTPYGLFPMEFPGRVAYSGGAMNADGSMVFGLHNQRRT